MGGKKLYNPFSFGEGRDGMEEVRFFVHPSNTFHMLFAKIIIPSQRFTGSS